MPLVIHREVLGVPVDYYASVDLEGFRKLIDRVGGVTVNVQTAINDPGYGGWDTPGKIGFKISTGKHTLDGETALAFVRSRARASATATSGAPVASSSSSSPSSASWSIRRCCRTSRACSRTRPRRSRRTSRPTASPRSSTLARKTDEKAIKKYVLGPPYSNHPTNLSTYILIPDMERIAKLSIELFGDESRYAATE